MMIVSVVMYSYLIINIYLLSGLYVSFEDLIYNVIEGTGVVIQVILDHLPGSNIDIMIDVNPLSATGVYICV